MQPRRSEMSAQLSWGAVVSPSGRRIWSAVSCPTERSALASGTRKMSVANMDFLKITTSLKYHRWNLSPHCLLYDIFCSQNKPPNHRIF